MLRRSTLKRKTPMKRTSFKKKTWEEVLATKNITEIQAFLKPKKPMKQRTPKRAAEEKDYRNEIPAFLTAHPVCPVRGTRTVAIHHSARRRGGWLNLKRYWIAVSDEGHRWIEDNGKEAEALGLMVRINESYKDHIAKLEAESIDLDEPLYYQRQS